MFKLSTFHIKPLQIMLAKKKKPTIKKCHEHLERNREINFEK